ncbi:MAG: class I SAM-dependent methyltransferase [Isosphaeraceae bacterium]
MSEPICHRRASHLSFAGIGIHAAENVHEGALATLGRLLQPGARVADLGAGSGAFSLRLQSAGYKPVAVDMNVDVRPEGIPFLEADVTDLTSVFEPESLPAAVAIECMEHLHDPIRFLESVWQVLEPAGVFLSTTPNVIHPYSRLKFAVKGTFWLFSPEWYWSTGHITPLPEWLLRAHLTNAGFQDIEHGLIGDFDFHGMKRMLIKAMRRRLHSTGAPLGVEGDGSNLVMVGRKPS